MAAITFDPHDFVRRLRDAGFDEKQAETVVRVLAEAQGELVTKAHLDARLHQELAPVRTDLSVIKWMLEVLLAGDISLVTRAFFP